MICYTKKSFLEYVPETYYSTTQRAWFSRSVDGRIQIINFLICNVFYAETKGHRNVKVK